MTRYIKAEKARGEALVNFLPDKKIQQDISAFLLLFILIIIAFFIGIPENKGGGQDCTWDSGL